MPGIALMTIGERLANVQDFLHLLSGVSTAMTIVVKSAIEVEHQANKIIM